MGRARIPARRCASDGHKPISDPKGMLAVITGASSGLGAMFARKLAARGYDLLLIARREDRLQSLAREIGGQFHVRTEILAADLTDDTALEAAADRIREAADLGLLVNNAGFGTLGYFFDTDPKSQEQMHQLHVIATMRLSHAALANLVPRAAAGTGIINVSSVAGFSATPQNVSYCATKTWMNRFTEGLAMELGAKSSPVTVQALCPGFIRTEFQDTMGMDATVIPASLWMSTDFVVAESLRGFDRRAFFVIPGWRYKLLVWIMKLVPSGLIRSVSIRAARRYKQPKK
jgi:short-subunit dehydrogenase